MKAVKRCVYVLILIVLIGSLELISLAQKRQESYLLSLNPFIFGSHPLNSLVQQSYLLPNEDNYNTGDEGTILENLEKFVGLLLIVSIGLLNSSLINPYWELLFDKAGSFPYILFFASLSLRSPPLFS